MKTDSIVKKILDADKAYHQTGYPVMSDFEYDTFKKELKKIDPYHPLLAKIGHEPSLAWKKADHSIPMGSLNNVFSEQDFKNWSSRFQYDLKFVAQPKLDGLSISLRYKDSKLIQAITRGNGFEGEDITENALLMRGTYIKGPFSGLIRGEIMLSKKDFEKINSTLPEDHHYKNPRNAASGISRRLDGKFCQYLIIMPYDIKTDNGVDIKHLNEDEKIKKLKDLGFSPPYQIIGDIRKMIWAYNEMKKRRKKYSYNIDGVVIKVCDYRTQEEMGMINNRPRAQIAWKFESPGAITKLVNVTWDIGRTGVVTPLGHVEPVDIDGSTIKKVTLHNIAEIERLGVGIGDTVMLIKAGDIIPKIIYVEKHEEDPIQIPFSCPNCEEKLKNDGIRLICLNENCSAKRFLQILNWIKVTGIDNFGESLADKLFNPIFKNEAKLKSIYDIYQLTAEDIASLEGWGVHSANAIIKNIDKTRNLKPVIFLVALGIPNISHKTSENLLKAFGSVENILKIKEDDITALKGYSDISAAAIINGLKKHTDEIKKLLKIINLSDDGNKGKLSGKTFCFTGVMSQPRSKYQEYVISNGGQNLPNVTKDLDYLVCNKDTGSSKTQKAKKYNTKIITEQEFLNMIEISPYNSKPEKNKIENLSLFKVKRS